MMDLDNLFGVEPDENVVDNADKIISETRNLLNEKFGDINFIEEGHRYFIDGDEYIPVSNIIKEYEQDVDWDEKAGNYAKRYGRKKEDVQWEWKYNNLKATISGTRTHEFGESYTNLMSGHPELICNQNKPQYIAEHNILIPTYPKEDVIRKFYCELEKNLHPIGAEFKLSTKYIPDVRKICGTCDILFWDSDKKGFVIGDWKTNAELKKSYIRMNNIMMKYPLTHMFDDALDHYRIQFNLYRTMLQSIGINIVGMILIWLKEDGSYQRINIDTIDEKTIDMLIRK